MRRQNPTKIIIFLKLVNHGMWTILKFSFFWSFYTLSLFESESVPVSSLSATEKILVHTQKSKNFPKEDCFKSKNYTWHFKFFSLAGNIQKSIKLRAKLKCQTFCYQDNKNVMETNS